MPWLPLNKMPKPMSSKVRGVLLDSYVVPPAVIVAFTMQPPPPASRFVGKSPEYIRVYTQTYKAKVRNRQAGPAYSGLFGWIGCFILS